MNELINEFREGFQIPPYISDNQIEMLLNQSIAWVKIQVPFTDVNEDISARELVLNRTFYAYNHQLADFEADYESTINTWVFSNVSGVE